MAQPRREEFTIEEAKAAVSKIQGLDWQSFKFTLEDVVEGMEVELEHGTENPVTNITNDDPVMTAKIALAHLMEADCYYKHLEEMEQKIESNKELKEDKEEAGELALKMRAAEKIREKLFSGGEHY